MSSIPDTPIHAIWEGTTVLWLHYIQTLNISCIWTAANEVHFFKVHQSYPGRVGLMHFKKSTLHSRYLICLSCTPWTHILLDHDSCQMNPLLTLEMGAHLPLHHRISYYMCQLSTVRCHNIWWPWFSIYFQDQHLNDEYVMDLNVQRKDI